MFDLAKTLKSIKKRANKDNLGMILVHNGVVRKTSKENNEPVKKLYISYDKEKLQKEIKKIEALSFIEAVEVWINSGWLEVGDDIMYVVLAGDRRKNILPVFENLIETIKNEIVKEVEEK